MYMNSTLLVVKRLKAHQIIFDPNMSLHQVKMLFWVLSTIFDQINTVFLTIFLLPQSSYYSWKIKGIFTVGTLRQDGSRGCEIPTGKEMRKSSYRAINQFTEKSGLVFCVWFDYCQVITISNSLVRMLFPMQSDMLLRKKKIVLIPRPASVEICNRFVGVSSKQICNTTIKHNWMVENGTIVLLFTWFHLPV